MGFESDYDRVVVSTSDYSGRGGKALHIPASELEIHDVSGPVDRPACLWFNAPGGNREKEEAYTDKDSACYPPGYADNCDQCEWVRDHGDEKLDPDNAPQTPSV